MLHHHSVISLTLLFMLALLSLASPALNKAVLVNVRIEGVEKTIFEGPILTRGHNLTAPSGESHHCDGTNNNANRLPSATFNSAFDDAAQKHGLPYTVDFYPSFDDFFVTSIGEKVELNTQFWGQYLNYRENQIGGCQLQVSSGDLVLFVAFLHNVSQGKPRLLKLTGPHFAHACNPVILTVTDGEDGSVVAGAEVNGQKTNSAGQVSVTFMQTGRIGVKAEKSGSIRSNQLDIVVV